MRSNPRRALSKVDTITDLVLAIFRVHDTLMRRGDELVAPIGLTAARWQVLGAIALAGEPLSVPAIGKAMGLSRQGVQKQVDLLRGEGLLMLRGNPSHQRSPLVALTRDGRAAYERASRIWAVEARLLAREHPLAEFEGARRVVASLITSLDRSRAARRDEGTERQDSPHRASPRRENRARSREDSTTGTDARDEPL